MHFFNVNQMNQKKIILWSITAALAGFLFGFDTVVISGADKDLQLLWGSSDFFHGTVVMGSALWGTLFGALIGGYPTNVYGRKKTLIIIGVLYTVSAIGSGLAINPISFSGFRFLGGIGVGVSTIAAPAYIAEIAPSAHRGKLVSMYQFNIVLGILMAYLSNFLFSSIEHESWRWMIGVEAFPAFIYTILAFFIPKSPRWLISKNRIIEATEILKTIDSDHNAEEIVENVKNSSSNSKATIWDKKYRKPVIWTILIAMFNQLSGINAFLYYAPRIFQEAGLGEQTALLSSIGIGVVNLAFTLLGVLLIDRSGRKTLIFYGSIGYIVSLSLVSISFLFNWNMQLVPVFFFLFIAAHAIGQGAVIWVFISEIFPIKVRSYGQTLGSSTHWILAAIIPSLIPFLFSFVGPATVFIFFTIMMVLQLFFVKFSMPETKGIALEKMQDLIK